MTVETFPWPETEARLRAALASGPLELDRAGRAFVRTAATASLRLAPPLLLPIEGRDAESYLQDGPERPGLHVVLLLQAGAAALGLWHDDELLDHKVFRRYVVRGQGKAQPTHMKTKGKSRYGSRLRLQNARRLLAEVNERLARWWHDHEPERLFWSCPVRLWADLHRADPSPPFAADRGIKIPRDVGVPGHRELLSVHGFLAHGRIEVEAPADAR